MSAHAGLYVHVPFCLTRCGYCDFNTYAGLDHLTPSYVDALRVEADLVADAWTGVRFVSLFIGGGTPTMLRSEVIGDLIARLRDRFEIDDDAEVTCEANPDTVDEGSLRALRAAGITRLSLGVQSFDPAVLRSLDRVHSAESARRAFTAARAAGFDNVNLDLIYAAEGESDASWRATLEEAIALEPEHLSCYALTVEPNTLLGRQVLDGDRPAPDPEVQADRYEATCAALSVGGFTHYEVSNWAKPGRECRHNLGYWEGRPYLGLGAGAHSSRDGRRWWNVRPPQAYLRSVGAGRAPVGGEEVLDDEATRTERLLLGLRTASGVPESLVPGALLDDLVEAGLGRLRDHRLTLTGRGMLLANEVVASAGAYAGARHGPTPLRA